MENLANRRSTIRDLLTHFEEIGNLKDLDAILSSILKRTRQLTRADAGSIFLVEDDHLRFAYVQNDTLFELCAPNKEVYNHAKLPIDERSLVGFVGLSGRTLAIEDAYDIPTDAPYHFNKSLDTKAGYRTTSILTVPLRSSQGKLVGVMQLINARNDEGKTIPFDDDAKTLVSLLAGNASTAIERGQMTRELVLRMMRMAELRDPKETGAHVQRVGAYSAEIYKRWVLNRLQTHETLDERGTVPPQGDPDGEITRTADLLRLAAMLHDVGKVGISDSILKKPEPLSKEEYSTMKQHAFMGARLFCSSTSELDRMCYDITLAHHEKWDGTGYPGVIDDVLADPPLPKGPLASTDIPLPARIVALADVYDALCSQRSYKPPWPEERVLQEIESQAGRQFDPDVVEAFLQIHDVILAIRKKYKELAC
ncbi:MAG: HD domain-containing protein [Myxococcota bacterium]|jgi:response regulator RpfG family c-di-GMP phosphodiesterase|nr:HD domain-containing protein [Myxococcota bacterium]